MLSIFVIRLLVHFNMISRTPLNKMYINKFPLLQQNTQLLRQPVPTNKGKFVYRQDSITRSSQPDKPFKIKPKNIRTHRTPQLEYTAQRETYM